MTQDNHPLMTSLYLHERSWVGVQENLKVNDIALIPVGAIEQHGAHTPHMLDTCWATAMAEGIAAATGAIIAPPIYCGWSTGHMAYPGTITIRASVLCDYIVDVARSLMINGYRKFVIINGNRVANLPPLIEAALKIRLNHGAWAGCLDSGLTTIKETSALVYQPGGLEHAGDAETSFLLAYRPDLVDMSKAEAQPPCPNPDAADIYEEGPLLFPPFFPAWEEGAASAPHMTTAKYATAEKGRAILNELIAKSVAYVEVIGNRPVGPLRNLDVPI